MPAEIITRTEFSEYVARSGSSGFTNARLDDALARAVDSIRQAALNHYTSASFELLTATTAPPELRSAAFALGLHELTKGDAGRSESISTAYTEASRTLGFIAGGTTHYDQSPGAVLVAKSGAKVSLSMPASRRFDFEDATSTAAYRHTKL